MGRGGGGREAAASGVRAQTWEGGGQAAPWIHPLHLGLYTPPSLLHVPFLFSRAIVALTCRLAHKHRQHAPASAARAAQLPAAVVAPAQQRASRREGAGVCPASDYGGGGDACRKGRLGCSN